MNTDIISILAPDPAVVDSAEEESAAAPEWWRTAVIYQIYPRSFADSDGDGIGDLRGIRQRLPALAELGVDAIWLSPFFTSPQRDAGYDVADYCDVDPVFGTLVDFDRLLETARGLGLKTIVDLVPNHTASTHPWFVEALAAGEGSAERGHYIFRDGTGEGGELPPNNWISVFGGPAWTRVVEPDGSEGQWYLHLFDSSQPDLDWQSEWVRAQFRDILRFWLDRGVDGFRVDVAHGLMKADGLPDFTPDPHGGSMGGGADSSLDAAALSDALEVEPGAPFWGQDTVHEIYRDWRRVLDEYDGDRAMCGEAWVEPLSTLARWVRPDEMHQTFNFAYLDTAWRASALRSVIDDSIAAFTAVGAPSTWVLSNHDVVRHSTRLSLTADNPQGQGLSTTSPGLPDTATALHRARAASALMLALPGSSYLYQGEELGLPEALDLPDDSRQDPTWFRTGGERYGRDGCRVPIPWESAAPAYGFSASGRSWLPQPADWAPLARDRQRDDPASTLSLYRAALELRAGHRMGEGAVEWLHGYDESVLAFRNSGVTVIANLGSTAVRMPKGSLMLASGEVHDSVPPDVTVWLR